MPKKRPTLAKFARPHLHDALARERLFARLDEACERCRAVCVIGPPGAGKTTLVATWHEDRGVEGIWFQLDAGDADPATFFYYLGQALGVSPRAKQRRLPLLTAEYLADLPGFSRRYFRDLFGCLPHGATLVLDNYQDVPAENVLHHLIAEAIQEVPPGLNLIAVSRRDPPDCYARLIANENVAFIDWNELKLTEPEALAIAARNKPLTKVDAKALHVHSGGWVAGLTLLMQRAKRAEAIHDLTIPEQLQDVFDYFAAEVFAQMDTAEQVVLMRLAFLPNFNATLAQQLSQSLAAGKLLDQLFRRHLFIDRRPGHESTYQFHALFRTFLQHRAQQHFSAAQCAQLRGEAAQLLESAGAWEVACELRSEQQDWPGLRRLLLQHARTLLQQGRGQTLRDWIEALPLPERSAEPWLPYWHGMSLLLVEPERARRLLEEAFHQFQTNAAASGQLLAAAGLADSYYFEWRDDRPLDHWIAILDRLLERPSRFECAEDELRPHVSIVAATIRRHPSHPRLRGSVEHIVRMLRAALPPEVAVNAAGVVLNYIHFVPDLVLLNSVTHTVANLVEDSSVAASSRIHWYGRLSFCHHRAGDNEAALRCADLAIELAGAHGLGHFLGFLLFMRGLALTAQQRTAELKSTIRRYEEVANVSRPLEHNGLWFLRACMATLEDDLPRAHHCFQAAVKTADESGLIPIQAWDRVEAIATLAVLGGDHAVNEAIAYTRALIAPTPFHYLARNLDLIEAWRALQQSNLSRCHALLRQALGPIAGEPMARDYLPYAPRQLKGEIFAEALRAGIETATVRDIIRRYRVRPSSQQQEQWPWAIKIYTLGRFALLVEDAPLVFGRKSPKKALALLKLTICGRDAGVSEQHLLDTLWPEHEGDKAYEALTSTVYRLRRWLGIEGVLKQQGGVVALDSSQCWVDAWALEACIDQRQTSSGDVLQRYRGLFLPDDQDALWTNPLRERLRVWFVGEVCRRAAAHEKEGRLDEALRCYERGLGIDDLAEPFYQGMMRCYATLGRADAAHEAYRRLRNNLSLRLDAVPSAATERLMQSL